MRRKDFISSVGTATIGLTFLQGKADGNNALLQRPLSYKVPPYLKKGDTIGITSPAGFITAEELMPAMQVMESWEYKIKIGKTIGKKVANFGGTDEERRADFQAMLDDPAIKAIMCARGGYGVVRIIDALKWERFIKEPKWVIGFSDVTVMHSHIHQVCKIASIHSKMTNSFPADWATADPLQVETILSIREALAGKTMAYKTTLLQTQNRQGTGEGVLIGGNLKLLESLAGTASDITTDGKILFVEDTGEYLYSIDRMFWNLSRTGKLKGLKGLIIGGFKIKPDDEGEEFGKTLQDIVLEKVSGYSYPVCFEFPVGHQRANYALKCGVMHRLTVSKSEVTLMETI